MKILISDKVDDSSISILKKNGCKFDYLPEITPEELLAIIANYVALIVRSRTKVTKEVIVEGKNLKAIGRVGSGVDNIDMEAVKAVKIIVVNAPNGNSQAVAEHTIGLILALLRKYPKAFASMRQGLWLKKELNGIELCGKTVGILGYGHIGQKVEKLIISFGASPIIYSRSYQTVDAQELFENSDIVTIHLSLNKDTRGFVTKSHLKSMKPSAFFINASRGEIINEDALYLMLSEGKIAGAALDVFGQEPMPADSKWRKLENVILTPHIGASTKEALERASLAVAEDVIRVLKGEKPRNKITDNK